ncbi:uncharacterized protein [Misgurnus anguillicaudatus]|uniref:uncharacterized protein isoform X2 n=1 Tax=Misgurnus anguillicaudatus TaxID=75329 RepID=UPI003CCF1F9C
MSAVNSHMKDALIIPLWTPGHYTLCVLRPQQQEILLLDSKYPYKPQGFQHEGYQNVISDLAKSLVNGIWTERTGIDIKGLPPQPYGNDCGIFILMYAWYIVTNSPFDFSIHDMAELRRWWCVIVMENLDLEGHGRKFAHWTDMAKAVVMGKLQPVFRIPRKRKLEQIMQEHAYTKKAEKHHKLETRPESLR